MDSGWLELGELKRLELGQTVSFQKLNELGFSLDDSARMITNRLQEVLEYTGESKKIVSDKINGAIEKAKTLWGELKPDNEEKLLQFHSQTERKIYSVTGICDYIAVIRELSLQRILKRGKPAHILDFGGSHGHFTIAAAQAGLDVTYADIGLEIRKFVQWRVGKRNLKINFAPIKDNKCVFTNNTYDYIICLDVISHLPNPSQYLRDFYGCLKDDGEFFLGDDLFDFSHPWHLGENKIYTDISKKQELFKDFKFIEHLWANCDILGKVTSESSKVH